MRCFWTCIGVFWGLTALGATNVLRGPYLNFGSPTGMVVRWRTDLPCNSVVRYGTNAASLDRAVTNTPLATEHVVVISGLNQDTKYFYSIGSSLTLFASGADHYFRTSPTNTRPTRVWVIGDFGTSDGHQAAVRNAYTNFAGTSETDVWLMLGDNAYGSGTDWEYQQAVFNMYPRQLRNMVVWPTIGNHDAASTDPTTGEPPYFSIFTLPQNGEVGGVASGTEWYYSFDYGNIHFVCLDTERSDRSPTGAMVTWLRNDLAATTKEWIVAFFHHPPYSWGTHHSDYDGKLTEVRENILPVLEEYGTDLVLAGHSHVYERSFLIDRHYDYSWNFNATNVIDGSMGNPYQKPGGAFGIHGGTVYAVCGNSGQGGYGAFDLHPAMATNDGGYGSIVMDFDGPVVEVKYIDESGDIYDSFAIDKGAEIGPRPAMALRRGSGNAVVTWPFHPQYTLESAAQVPGTNWQAVGGVTTTARRTNAVTIPTSAGNRFYRLKAQ